MRWPQYYYCNGLGTQKMKDPCYPVTFNNKAPWQQTHQPQKHQGKALRLELLEDVMCVWGTATRVQAISHSTSPGLPGCVLAHDHQNWEDQQLDNSQLAFSCHQHTVLMPPVVFSFVSFLAFSREGCEPICYGIGPIHWNLENDNSLRSIDIPITMRSVQELFFS